MTRFTAYVDGFNLYYGGKSYHKSNPGWKWLNIRSLLHAKCSKLIKPEDTLHITYFTARVKQRGGSVTASNDQSTYLIAIERSGCVDEIVFGNLKDRIKNSPLAVSGKNGKPQLVSTGFPVEVRQGANTPVPDAWFNVSVAQWEEKETDVNIACHLLRDIYTEATDHAIVVSNDSDLGTAVRMAQQLVPVGVINPGQSGVPSQLRPPPSASSKNWMMQLGGSDYTAHQLSNPVTWNEGKKSRAKPKEW